jgi:hypothetical protein
MIFPSGVTASQNIFLNNFFLNRFLRGRRPPELPVGLPWIALCLSHRPRGRHRERERSILRMFLLIAILPAFQAVGAAAASPQQESRA